MNNHFSALQNKKMRNADQSGKKQKLTLFSGGKHENSIQSGKKQKFMFISRGKAEWKKTLYKYKYFFLPLCSRVTVVSVSAAQASRALPVPPPGD